MSGAIELPAYGWTPRNHQIDAWEALQDESIKTTVLAWHRRAGKDEIALHNTAIKAMERVGNYWHMLPEQEQARKALWESVNPRTQRVRWKDAFPPEIIQHVDNQAMKITFKNNSTWQLLGSDNYNSLVGTTPVGMTFSEAALADPAAFGFFSPILMENNGWSVHISSVRGKNHFYNLYLSTQSDPNGYAQHLSAEDTDVFTPLQLAMERKKYIDLYGSALGNSMFEQEYLSAWESAVIGAVWGQEITDLKKEGRALPLIYDPRYPVDTSWDIGVGDTNVVLFWQTIGNFERLIDWYSSSDTGLDHYAEVLAEKQYYYGHHLGPHDIVDREWGANGLSRMTLAKKLGIHFKRMPNVSKTTSISAGASLIRRMQVNVKGVPVENPMDDCSFVLGALEEYRFKFDRVLRIMSKNPIHDWTSHYADGLATKALFAMGHAEGDAPRNVLQGRNASDNASNLRLRDIMSRKPRVRGAFG